MVKKIMMICVLATSLSICACSSNEVNKSGDNTQNSTTKGSVQYTTEDIKITNPDEALKRLEEGNKRFVNDNSQLSNVTSERREQLKEGQNPYAVIVSCSDSRVTPTTVFDAGLGEIFDIRIAGNVVDDDALGSIEYGVEHTGSPLVVVMGHESCGAVTAAYDYVNKNAHVEGNIQDLVEKIVPSVKKSTSIDEAIKKNVDNVANEIAHDEIVKHLMDNGKVKIVKAYYSLDGNVTFEEYK